MSNLISIIVPVYNMERYLDRCMKSILNQTYNNLEIILVDDGSTDGSPKMCDKYALNDSRIKVIHKENGGLSDARNAGLEIATGDFVGYVDSDDWIEPDMYERMITACIDSDAEMALCRYYREYDDHTIDDGTKKVEILDRESLLKIYITDKDGYMIYNSVWSKLFKRWLVEGVKFPKGRNSEDIMYTTKAICNISKAVYIDTCLYHYVIDRKDSIMNVARTDRMFKDEIPFWSEHIDYIRDNVSDEMADIAAYYYYKRLLSYYVDIKDKRISTIIKIDRDEINRIYSKDKNIVTTGDRSRMKLFLLNPALYRKVNILYERIIVRLKNKKRRM